MTTADLERFRALLVEREELLTDYVSRLGDAPSGEIDKVRETAGRYQGRFSPDRRSFLRHLSGLQG